MAYSIINFPTKKKLIEAIKNGRKVGVYNPGIGADLSNFTGTITLEGPHFPRPHTWYAGAEVVNGAIVKVK